MGSPPAPCASRQTGAPTNSCCARRRDSTMARRSRRGVLAHDSQSQGTPDHPAVPARFRGRAGRGCGNAGRAVRRQACARRAAVPRHAADPLPRLLCRPHVRRDQPGGAARLRPLQGRPLRARAFHRVRAGRGLVGRRAARCARPQQFRRGSLRVLPRPRRRLRGLHRQELSVPGGIHFADLGDALRLPGDPRRTREAGSDARRHAFGREALIDAFDFEWTNKTIMYGSYERTHSVFQNSDMMAAGKPGPEELALLEPFRDTLPEEVFGEPFSPPVSDGSGQDRSLLRKANQLLQQAGLAVKAGKRVNARGEPIAIEFLIDEPGLEPHHMPFIKNLGVLGIDATLRLVDPVQYRARVDQFDFDITVERFSFSTTPGDSLRSYLSSAAATLKGSQNLAGIADPVIDALIDRIIGADTRAAMVSACRALDRVIRCGRYWIPHWYKPTHWYAYWDVFARPAANPRYARGVPETWWYDRGKAAKLERAG